MKLAAKAAKGILWSGGSLIFANGFGFLVKLLLAYILVPDDFGIVGMATVITGFIQIISETGISQGLIQRDSKELNEVHFHTAFVSSLILGVSLFFLVSLIITPISIWFFNEEKLKLVIPFLSLQFLIKPFRIIKFSLLTKNLEFKKLAQIEIICTAVSSIIALILAFFGFGYWSLVSINVVSSVIAMPLYDRVMNWENKFEFSKQCFKDLFGFSAYVTLNNSLVYITKNMDYLIIGRILGSTSLGIYSFAFLLTDILRVRFMTVMNKVMYPVYGSIKNDATRIGEYYLTVIKINSLIIFPIMMLIFVYSDQLIFFIFGDKWIEAIGPLKILSIAIIIHTLGGTSVSVLNAIGKPNIGFKISLVDAFIVTLPVLLYFTHYFGISGACWAVVISKVFNRIAFQYYIFKYVNVSNYMIIDSIKYPLLGLCVSVLFGIILKMQFDFENIYIFVLLPCINLLIYILFTGYLMKKDLLNYYSIYKSTNK